MSIYLGNTLIAGLDGNGVDKSTTNGILKKQASENHNPIIENNEGTIVLKSGSKLYVGGVLGTITTEEDLDISNVGDLPEGTKDYVIVLYQLHSDFYDSVGGVPVEVLGKPPHEYYISTVYYSLDVQVPMYKPLYNTGHHPATLPICIVRTDGTVEPYIKDVYQIGDTCLVLKDSLKVSIPNGRNPDGTLNNLIVSSVDSILTDISGTDKIYIDPTGVLQKSSNCEYNQKENYNKVDGSNVLYAKIGDFSSIDDVIQVATKEDLKSVINYNNISNCITHIPQDIKLELNNGTLTLKAGSKVYVPNGFEEDGTTPYFNEVVIEEDIEAPSFGDQTNQYMFIVRRDLSSLDAAPVANFSSGTTPPTAGLFYNTATNNIDYYTNSTAQGRNYALPLCICSFESGTNVSIDQTFNGFGYIGSTVFVLPGLKGLIPNGRNADGTLRNTERLNTSVITRTYTTQSAKNILFALRTNDFINGLSNSYYDEANNYLYENNGAMAPAFVFAKCDLVSGVINSFQPKTAFHALDYNDKSTIVGWGMPDYSGTTTTGLTGSPLSSTTKTYTCPKNGWFNMQANRSSSGNTIFVAINGTVRHQEAAFSATSTNTMYPVNKGDIIRIYTDGTATTWSVNYANFIPSRGG